VDALKYPELAAEYEWWGLQRYLESMADNE